MKGYCMNPNKEYVTKIIDGIIAKNGHCPCRIKQTDATLCPCDEFVSTGVCKCKLFVAAPTQKHHTKSANKE